MNKLLKKHIYENDSVIIWLQKKKNDIVWLIYFNGMSTHQESFYITRLGNRIHYMFLFIFFVLLFLKSFFYTRSFRIRKIFKQFYLMHR